MKTWKVVSTLLLALSAIGCETAEEKARHVKEPLTASGLDSRAAVDNAYQESRNRLAAVENEELRNQLEQDVNALREQKMGVVIAAEVAAAEQARQEELMRRRAALQQQMKDAVAALEVQTRPSDAFSRPTRVLVLTNAQPIDVSVDVKCFTADGSASKTFFVTVPNRGRAEIGWMQGWSGNFQGGERCNAQFGGEEIWSKTIP